MMNCEEYKQAITTDPTFDGGAGHVSACADCQAYRAEMQALNIGIAGALQIDVPKLSMPELPEIEPSVDSDKVVSLASWRKFSRPTGFALAATVLLAAVIGIRMSGVGGSYGSLEEQILAHVDREPGAFRETSAPVSERRLARTVPANIAHLNHDAGVITYAQSCRINGNTVPHLVIRGERGPITILLMPEESVGETRIIDGLNVRGVILPVGGGSIAIIGEREEQLERVKQFMLESVNWST